MHALDQGRIQTLVYPNEFNVGYVALIELAEQMGLATPDVPGDIGHVVATRENLYDPAVERILFPIIQ